MCKRVPFRGTFTRYTHKKARTAQVPALALLRPRFVQSAAFWPSQTLHCHTQPPDIHPFCPAPATKAPTHSELTKSYLRPSRLSTEPLLRLPSRARVNSTISSDNSADAVTPVVNGFPALAVSSRASFFPRRLAKGSVRILLTKPLSGVCGRYAWMEPSHSQKVPMTHSQFFRIFEIFSEFLLSFCKATLFFFPLSELKRCLIFLCEHTQRTTSQNTHTHTQTQLFTRSHTESHLFSGVSRCT